MIIEERSTREPFRLKLSHLEESARKRRRAFEPLKSPRTQTLSFEDENMKSPVSFRTKEGHQGTYWQQLFATVTTSPPTAITCHLPAAFFFDHHWHTHL